MVNKSRIDNWLSEATKTLQSADIESARLDAEIILAHTLRKSRTWLHAHSEQIIDIRLHEIANSRLELRRERVPIAYIIGHKEFYGRRFKVTPATLTPRPESETIIDLLKKLPLKSGQYLVDVGTGTGCLGITAKLELPGLNVNLLDSERTALKVAEQNAELLQADVTLIKSNLLKQYPFTPNIILANLPYVDESWQRSPETNHEPAVALFASDNGLSLIKSLLEQSAHRLAPNGAIILEADPRQHHAIATFADNLGLTLQAEQGFCQSYLK